MLNTLRQFMRPPPGLGVDFTQPPQAPALAPADGVSWRVFANPVALFIGGVSAVLLELAQPAVRTGVWEHSSFRRDPAGRLHRTGYAAMVTVYAPQAEARAMIARVVKVHCKVQGRTPAGTPYEANDPQLLTWVQATAVFGFVQAYHCYVSALSPQEKDAAFAEGLPAARLYGAVDAPAAWAQWQQLLQATAPELENSAILTQFLDLMEQSPLLPRFARPLQRLLVRAAVSMTPAPVREFAALQGRGLRRGERHLVRALAAVAGSIPLRGLPPAQAAQRMRPARR